MFEKIRKNYNTASIFVRIFYGLSLFAANWQTASDVCKLYSLNNVWAAIAIDALCACLFVLILPFVVKFVLNLLHVYSIPLAEYTLWAMLFFGIYHAAVFLISIPSFFTPILSGWTGSVGELIVSAVCFWSFYKVTSNLYFNVATKCRYFKVMAIFFFVYNGLTLLISLAEVLQ